MKAKLPGDRAWNQRKWAPLIVGAVLAATLQGCYVSPSSTGSFNRTLTVNGPVLLELISGAGAVQVRPGTSGEVHIHGDIRAHFWFGDDPQRRVDELAANPPIEQHGNLIHVGGDRFRMHDVSINYTIEVPAETELHSTIGSGNADVRGIRGPVRLTAGSGRVTLEDVREDAEVASGSGRIQIRRIGGEVHAKNGSGSITLAEIHGDIRASSGSGHITISEPGGRITARTGSGGVTVSGAAADLRAQTGAGHVTIDGNPARGSFWEVHTGAGGVTLQVPANASFRLHAHARSGRVRTDLPIVLEEQSRRDLRARVGDGAARLEVICGSGTIHIKS